MNAEVAVSQWELQIGPVQGIDCAHQIHLLRYIIVRTTEYYNCCADFHPKPLKLVSDNLYEWNGSGLHTNFSTEPMRENNGYEYIISSINKLELKHKQHMLVYGEDNHLRMTGKCETANIDKFTFGIADRTSSIRIPSQVFKEQKGYFEDRRPASNADPYLVCSKIYETCCL
jgi:glutamine synthetase